MASLAARVRTIVGFGLLGFAITTLAGGIWSALIVLNLRSSPAIPWSVPVMALLLWLGWSYLGGKWWPTTTSETRRRYLRANSRSLQIYLLAALASGFSVIALAGIWIILLRLVKTPPNAFSDLANYPRITVALMIVMGSLVSPLMEEAGFRGYFQVALERQFRAPLAVVISSVVFSVAHGPTQGFVWPKLLFYFLVGVAFGATAYLTNSTLPAIPAHFVGLLAFFTLIWPRDATRPLVTESGTDTWFWIHAAQAIVATGLAAWSFLQLARVRHRDASNNKANGGQFLGAGD